MDPLRDCELGPVGEYGLASQRRLLAQWRLCRDRRRRPRPCAKPPHHKSTVAGALHYGPRAWSARGDQRRGDRRENSHGRDNDAWIAAAGGWCVSAFVRAPAWRIAVRTVRAAAFPANLDGSARDRRPEGATDKARHIAGKFGLCGVPLSLNPSPDREIDSYTHAAESLLNLIRAERYASRSPASRRQRAETRLSRIRTMLEALGEPQRSYPAVHVTGTSGKGSTAAAVAAILTAAGYRVGLRTSPYLQVPTEKLQIGPSLIDACSFASLVTRVLDTAACFFPPEQTELPISYAEVWSVLGYWWFSEREIDIAVVEVGAGGRFDATNVIDPIVSVITSVGLDHLITLGPTITDIAWHKAGIIKTGSTAVVGELPAAALSVIAAEAKSASADLIQAFGSDGARSHAQAAASGFLQCNADVATEV